MQAILTFLSTLFFSNVHSLPTCTIVLVVLVEICILLPVESHLYLYTNLLVSADLCYSYVPPIHDRTCCARQCLLLQV